MVKTVVFDAPGGPEVMKIIDVEVPPPAKGELQHCPAALRTDRRFRFQARWVWRLRVWSKRWAKG